MNPSLLFSSERLGFRLWQDKDLPEFAAMNADTETMRYFDKPLSAEESQAMMERMNQLYTDRGYCYFAVELLKTGKFIGMIGLGWKAFEADFTPCVDIGWRLDKRFWNQGYASEGAKRCLEFASESGIDEVLSMASIGNEASTQVMKKIGMSYWKDFEHPDLVHKPDISTLHLYRISLHTHFE
jgi:RimJ/RimL family protein N-acetyltransferase